MKIDLAVMLRRSLAVRSFMEVIGPVDDVLIVGGRARNAYTGVDDDSADVDAMVPDESLSALWGRLPQATRNRHGNIRLEFGSFKADVFSPGSFYDGFDDFNGALSFFDLNVNAIGVSMAGSSAVYDPIGARDALDHGLVTPNVKRWLWTTEPVELAVLRARLLKFLLRNPRFKCALPEMVWQDSADLFELFPDVVIHHVGISPSEAILALRERLGIPS